MMCLLVGVGNAWAEDVTATLTGAAMLESTSPSTSYADHTTGITDDKGYTYKGRWTYQKSGSNFMQMIQLKKTESSNTTRVMLPTFQGNIKTITIKATDASSTAWDSGTGASTGLYLSHGTTYTTNGAKNDAILTIEKGSDAHKTYVFDLTSLEDSYTGDNLFIASIDGAIRIWSIEVVFEKKAKVNVSGVSLNKSTLNLLKGAQETLTATVTPSDATNKNIVWSSNDESIATVTDGVVTAVSEGTATITAKSEDDETLSASCAVTVTTPAKTGNVYEKVTSNLTDWTGKYLIVYEPQAGTGYAFNASLTTLDNANNYKEISTSNSIEGDVLIDQYVFEVEKNGEGYSIKSQTDLYIGLGSYSNGLSTNAKQTQYVNNFAYNTTKECAEVMLDFGSDGKCYLQFNDASNQMRFRYYKTGSQKNIQLYKLVEPPYKEKSLTFAAEGVYEGYPYPCYYATFSSDKDVFIPGTDLETYEASIATVVTEEDHESLVLMPLDEANYVEELEIGGKTYYEGYYVPANTGVLLMGMFIDESATIPYFEVSGVDVPAVDADFNMLRAASVAKEETGFKFYKLAYSDSSKDPASLGFYWGAENGGVFDSRVGSAYLAVPAELANAKGFRFVVDDATAIKEVQNAECRMQNGVYNLAGQRVASKNFKGIVIKNGKKMLNK